MTTKYDLDKIKFSADGRTFEKAIDLYENGKVTKFKEGFGHFSAMVLGTHPYRVTISSKHYDHGNCECYLGRNDILCKHMVAVAIRAVMKGKELSDDDKRLVNCPICSGRLGTLNQEELAETKGAITAAMRCIKPYNGPSRIWFAYQDSLSEGCNRLTKIVSELPASEQTAKLLIDMLLRLDKKLCEGGVDDSDGTVGDFIEETVKVLKEYAKLDFSCVRVFNKLKNRGTCFGWEESLIGDC